MQRKLLQALFVLATIIGFSEACFSIPISSDALNFSKNEDMFETEFEEAPNVAEI